MGKKAKPAPAIGGAEKKQRTRQHVIAELSVNFVERLALKCGCAVQRPSPDYGFDLLLETFSVKGEV